MNNNPLVTVIIPTYKRSDNLLQTIDSVLKQTYSNIEIIVVDDNGRGTDCQKRTEEKLKKYVSLGRIVYIAHTVNRNGATARNTGFCISKGDYINYLDDDDELLSDKISMQVKALHGTEKQVGACYCNSIIRTKGRHGDLEFKTNLKVEGNLCLGYLVGRYFFNTSSILFKRESIEKLNGFDETFIRHQDYELMTRFFTFYKIICCSEKALLIYDLTKNRTYIHSAGKDILLKEKFLRDLKPYLETLGIFGEVAHKFWFATMKAAVLSKQYFYIPQVAIRSVSFGMFSFEEVCDFSKLIIKRILRQL